MLDAHTIRLILDLGEDFPDANCEEIALVVNETNADHDRARDRLEAILDGSDAHG